ncbi:hypothetical protein N182_06715 [Sinorhizobium sp. GL2]|nr:hypothetical protein N182_06715 [Sinorhizobium sp. GL2]
MLLANGVEVYSDRQIEALVARIDELEGSQ